MKEQYSAFVHSLEDMRNNEGRSAEQMLEYVTQLAAEGHKYAQYMLAEYGKDRGRGGSVNSFWTRAGGGATRAAGVHPDAE